jgi:hypothetical protein
MTFLTIAIIWLIVCTAICVTEKVLEHLERRRTNRILRRRIARYEMQHGRTRDW